MRVDVQNLVGVRVDTDAGMVFGKIKEVFVILLLIVVETFGD